MNWLTVSEVSTRADIPPETVRRYINRHHLHLQVKKGHKSYQIAESCVLVFIQIRSLYAEGKQADEVEVALAKSGRPTIVTVNESGGSVNVNMAESLYAIDSKMNAIVAMLMNVDERLKASEHNNDLVNEDIKLIREQFVNVHEEVASTTEEIQKIQRCNEEINAQLGEMISRVDTYQKRKRWWQR